MNSCGEATTKLNLLIDQGATFKRMLTFKSPSGNAIDLTDWEFSGEIRQSYSSASVVERFSYEIQDQSTDKGKVLVYIAALDTANIPVNPAPSGDVPSRPPTYYIYDMEYMDTESNTVRFLQGNVKVSPDVTR